MSQTPAMIILKILTPSSIITMTGSAKRQNRVSLTKMLLKRETIEGAREEGGERGNVISSAKQSAQSSPGQMEEERGEWEGQGEDSSKSASIFLLEQKRKFRQTEMKLKKKELMSLYQSSAAVDISHDSAEEESSSGLTQFGTLLDKKQS